MKLFTNLPGNLRALFGFLRIATLLLAVSWLLMLTFQTWIQRRFVDDSKLMVTFGEVVLPASPQAVKLNADTAEQGAILVSRLRGRFQANISSKDDGLVMALRLALIPSMLVIIVFCWLVFTALRNLCSNIESGEVFSETNLRLIRSIGVTLVAYSLACLLVGLWATFTMNRYLAAHVVMVGLPTEGSSAVVSFNPTRTFLSIPSSLILGCLVLVIAEAFRQGLVLKNENDLTV